MDGRQSTPLLESAIIMNELGFLDFFGFQKKRKEEDISTSKI
jgi:hypothetical protein